MKIRSPQEKKALSYVKDRRNAYGESDKGSRKSIQRNKVFPNRALRHLVTQILNTETVEVTTEENLEIIDSKIKSVKRRNWKKFPDISLKEWVQNRFEYRRKMFRVRIERQKNIK